MAMQAGTDQPVVLIQQVASTPGTDTSNPTREQQRKCRGITLVVFGGIDIVLGIIYLIYQVARLSSTHIFSGVWGGLFIISTGCVAIAAGRTHLRGAIIALLAMSIINILIAGFIVPVCLGADITLAEVNKPIGAYDVDRSAVIPLLGILGFACFLTTSILTCVDLCNCCNQGPRPQAARTQMVMVSPDGKIIPVQVIDASGTQHVVPIGSDNTALQWRNGQHNGPVQPSAPPPPYSLHPEPLPNHSHGAAARESTTSGIYCEVLDSGVYLHPPPLADEDGYEVMRGPGQAAGKDDSTDGGEPFQQQSPSTVKEGPFADEKHKY